ncbi:MAG: helix-turn-helix domain-containing protein [Prevotellaceae bacterium]|jgi:transcriptional regulator with XRE-family HTH domain|nr:helix-turn-helix domain-containing protein [Prevotellaceae bacterium]
MSKPNILNIIGDQIRVCRAKKKLSQENMAIEIGISVTAYSRIERGQTNISIGRLEQISNCLEVSLIRLINPADMVAGEKSIVKEGEHAYPQQDLLLQLEERLTLILEKKFDQLLEERLSRLSEAKAKGKAKAKPSRSKKKRK